MKRSVRELQEKELLELAAKAAGYRLHRYVNEVHHYEKLLLRDDSKHFSQWPEWNPLLNDGDRHRLQVTLKMTVAYEPSRGGWSAGAIIHGEFKWLAFDEREPYAIVCAAAEFAKAGQANQRGTDHVELQSIALKIAAEA